MGNLGYSSRDQDVRMSDSIYLFLKCLHHTQITGNNPNVHQKGIGEINYNHTRKFCVLIKNEWVDITNVWILWSLKMDFNLGSVWEKCLTTVCLSWFSVKMEIILVTTL